MAETVASRTTDGGTTLVLKRRKSNRFENGQYEYYVTEAGSNERVDRYEPTREDGMQQLRDTVNSYESVEESESNGMGGGFGIPGIGGGMDGGPAFDTGVEIDPYTDEEKDDDSPPWMW